MSDGRAAEGDRVEEPSDLADSSEQGGALDRTGPQEVGPEPDTGSRPRAGRHIEYREDYKGPLPHWRHLDEYERILPGAANRIFDSFEKQGDHRRDMERRLMSGSERRANVGQFLGVFVLVLVIVLGFVAVLSGHVVAGCSMVGAALTGGVLAYAFGFRPSKEDKD